MDEYNMRWPGISSNEREMYKVEYKAYMERVKVMAMKKSDKKLWEKLLLAEEMGRGTQLTIEEVTRIMDLLDPSSSTSTPR